MINKIITNVLISKLLNENPLANGEYNNIYKINNSLVLRITRKIYSNKLNELEKDGYILQNFFYKNSISVPKLYSSDIYNYCDNKSVYFGIMEYKKYNLLRYISYKNLDLSDKLDLCIQLISNVHKMHSLKYLHLDLNVKNILINNNKLYIIDFTSAIKITTKTKKLDFRRGTNIFLDSDLLLNKTVSFYTDVYACFIIMLIIFYPKLYYFLLAGKTISNFLEKNTKYKDITNFLLLIPKNKLSTTDILDGLNDFL